MAIELPIKKGQKFLSLGVEVEIVSVTGKIECYPVIDDYGDCYTLAGKSYDDDECDLQPIPATIEEGVEFSGEQYREEFERLVAEGREFEYLVFTKPDTWKRETKFVDHERYRLLHQHRDAVGNPLKVGDRVERVVNGSGRFTIERIECRDGFCFLHDITLFGDASEFRKLTTRTRPLCKKDLATASHPSFLNSFGSPLWPTFAGDVEVVFGNETIKYKVMIDRGYKWRPSADQPWQPCEVTEEVPV